MTTCQLTTLVFFIFMKQITIGLLLAVLWVVSVQAQTKYNYETVPGDPLKAKIYTLDNGLKVYMSVYKDAPRLQTMIGVRTGSKNDPADATGLAHYLEHMLFKGTSEIASLDWEKEKVLLKQISDLYEKNRGNVTEEERKKNLEEIDRLSNEAAQYVATNEYDKMVSSLGAKGTNAYTWVDQTVYINDIPTNGLAKWIELEGERFSELVLRLFHTELEAVYEEFNIGQNNAFRKVNKAMMEGLYPTHPYGTQTTIGTGEHLKRPSMEKIHAYFDKYYVPNNMAIILSGDFDPDEAVALIEKHFGDYKRQFVAEKKIAPLAPLTKVVEKEVFSPEAATVTMAWRLNGAKSEDAMKVRLMDLILANGQAGLIDLNLVQAQRTGPETYSYVTNMNDYSSFVMVGQPMTGQSLEEVQKLLLSQLAYIKKGAFNDWLLEAIINNAEYQEIKSLESNRARANKMLSAFLFQQDWKNIVNYYDRLRKYTKEDIVKFANEKIRDFNYVVVYKREGKAEDIYTVEKPKITPVKVNRDAISEFKKRWDGLETPSLTPVFLNFDEQIQFAKLNSGVELAYIKNPYNATFSLDYIVEMGEEHDPLLPLAIEYLPFLGTDKYTPAQLQEEFFKLGVSFDVYAAGDVSYVTLSGLERSLEEGVQLFEHVLANAKANEQALKSLIATKKKERVDEKKEKRSILYNAMFNYARYGENSPLMDRLSEKELDAVKSSALIDRIHNLTSYKHDVFYYGEEEMSTVKEVLNKHHNVPATLKSIPAKKEYKELATNENKVIFVSFDDMTQAEIVLLSKGTEGYNLNEDIQSRLYNQYFGSGLSSIVFQEIRESRALAYSAYAFNSAPRRPKNAHYYRAFVGTQADKLKEAIPAMKEIIEQMPVSEDLMQAAAVALTKKIDSERLTKSRIYWTYRNNKKKGYDRDIRKDVYDQVSELAKDKDATVKVIKEFQEGKIKGRKYTYLVLGDKEKIDMEFLKTLGTVEVFTIEEIFGEESKP